MIATLLLALCPELAEARAALSVQDLGQVAQNQKVQGSTQESLPTSRLAELAEGLNSSEVSGMDKIRMLDAVASLRAELGASAGDFGFNELALGVKLDAKNVRAHAVKIFDGIDDKELGLWATEQLEALLADIKVKKKRYDAPSTLNLRKIPPRNPHRRFLPREWIYSSARMGVLLPNLLSKWPSERGSKAVNRFLLVLESQHNMLWPVRLEPTFKGCLPAMVRMGKRADFAMVCAKLTAANADDRADLSPLIPVLTEFAIQSGLPDAPEPTWEFRTRWRWWFEKNIEHFPEELGNPFAELNAQESDATGGN